MKIISTSHLPWLYKREIIRSDEMYLKLFLSLLIFRRFTGRCLRAKRRGKLCSVNVVIENIMTCIFPPWWHLLCKFWRRFLFFFVDKVELCQLNSWKENVQSIWTFQNVQTILKWSKCLKYFEMFKIFKLFWKVQIVSIHFTADFLVAVLPIFVQGKDKSGEKSKGTKSLK